MRPLITSSSCCLDRSALWVTLSSRRNRPTPHGRAEEEEGEADAAERDPGGLERGGLVAALQHGRGRQEGDQEGEGERVVEDLGDGEHVVGGHGHERHRVPAGCPRGCPRGPRRPRGSTRRPRPARRSSGTGAAGTVEDAEGARDAHAGGVGRPVAGGVPCRTRAGGSAAPEQAERSAGQPRGGRENSPARVEPPRPRTPRGRRGGRALPRPGGAPGWAATCRRATGILPLVASSSPLLSST